MSESAKFQILPFRFIFRPITSSARRHFSLHLQRKEESVRHPVGRHVQLALTFAPRGVVAVAARTRDRPTPILAIRIFDIFSL